MRYRFLISLALLLTLAACQNKFLPRLFRVDKGIQSRLQLEESYFLKGYKISDNPLSSLYQKGEGLLLVTTQSQTDSSMLNLKSGFVTVDAQIKYRIAVELPSDLQADSIDISNRSVCQLLGLYHLPDSLKLYRCHSGYILVDSVKSSQFTAVLEASFVNQSEDTLQFSGSLKAKQK